MCYIFPSDVNYIANILVEIFDITLVKNNPAGNSGVKNQNMRN